MVNVTDLLCEMCGKPEPGRGGFMTSRAQLRARSKQYHDVTLKVCSRCLQMNLKRQGTTTELDKDKKKE